MTPKQKAKVLVYKYFSLTDHMQFEEAKQCSLIVINEMIEMDVQLLSYKKYLQEVKQEIKKL